MLDYYGDVPGPSVEEAKIQILNNINSKINEDNYLKYITNTEKTTIINNTIENNYNGISSYSGWYTFHMKQLINLCLSKLAELNTKKKSKFLQDNIVETISHNLSELVQTMSKMQQKIDNLEKELEEEKQKNKMFKKSIENKENMPDWELPIQAY